MDIIFCVNPNDSPNEQILDFIKREFRESHPEFARQSIMLYGVSGSGKTYMANKWLATHASHSLTHREIYNNTIFQIDDPKKRHTAKTAANNQSRRSHLVTTCTTCNIHCVDTAGLEQGEQGSTQINLDLRAVQTWMKKIANGESEQAVRSFSRTRKITQILNSLRVRTLVLCFRSTGVSLTCKFGLLGRQVHISQAVSKSDSPIRAILERLSRIEARLTERFVG